MSAVDPAFNGERWLPTGDGFLPLPKPATDKSSSAVVLAQGMPQTQVSEADAPEEEIPEAATPPEESSVPSQLPIAAQTEPASAFPATPLVADIPTQPEQSVAQTVEPAERSEVFAQAAYLQQGSEGSARLRVGGIYVLSPSVFAGATVDLSTGQAFSNTDQTGLSLSELYLTASPANLPELRFTVGLMDLTSYLDRNSFAKDSLTHFFNPVFQTNPALSTVNVASRPGALVNWTPVDAVSLTATTFSSSRDLGSFALDSFAGEVGVRMGNAIVRGTYVTSTDAGQSDGFGEIGSFDRGNGEFGARPGDRETGFGFNAEAFIPGLKLGFFGRYGWYTNQTLGASGQTYSLGVNGLDVFMPGDRLGLGYGRQLSNSDLRQASGGPTPDVWELFYDAQVIDNLRAGVSVQQRNAFSETYLGFRMRYDLMWNPLRRAAE
ncbi:MULTISPECIES: porin [Cyanophyceae]|uniref:Porin n=1 Tax=Leptolyngbya subtilissima DQ-A4 TaxID=2933933 RepID=A0ABV0K0H6_9CYAN|nr:porin [Nodosilinea sp. FACHB-141]MBD2110968.1 porin [Nodosilinea sp. FACHB-141]